ncbi:MAG: hypothetical protein KJO69_01580 [Gammaproteobacteria bacterium]|nr:hypothetical protein [Gammaproteobacteria bacterium]
MIIVKHYHKKGDYQVLNSSNYLFDRWGKLVQANDMMPLNRIYYRTQEASGLKYLFYIPKRFISNCRVWCEYHTLSFKSDIHDRESASLVIERGRGVIKLLENDEFSLQDIIGYYAL